MDELFAVFEVVVVDITVKVEFVDAVKFECFFVNFTDIVHLGASVQVLNQMQKLLISRVLFKRGNRDSIVDLFTK